VRWKREELKRKWVILFKTFPSKVLQVIIHGRYVGLGLYDHKGSWEPGEGNFILYIQALSSRRCGSSSRVPASQV
jgi:hypothetical protein